MAIEIKQLSIRSNVVQRAANGNSGNNGHSSEDGDSAVGETSVRAATSTLDHKTRAALLEECRLMVIEMLRRQGER